MPVLKRLNSSVDSVSACFSDFLRRVLELSGIDGMLVQQRLSVNGSYMPSLVRDPEHLEGAAPLMPVFMLNGARLVSRLTIRPSGGRVAVVLRNCEIRAFVELVKLKQGIIKDLLIIGFDCPGVMDGGEFSRTLEEGMDGDGFADSFCRVFITGEEPSNLVSACRICEHPVPSLCDLRVAFAMKKEGEGVPVVAVSENGERVLEELGGFCEADDRLDFSENEAWVSMVRRREGALREVFEETRAKTGSVRKLAEYFSRCINCYNCRTVCPVCYCKECVFNTDTFAHDPFQYMSWAANKGILKMPTDTIFFHLTRLAHMSTSCVGCGQCSYACPQDIPVMELFRSVAWDTQKAFDYEAGRDWDEPLPPAVYREDEFQEIVE